MLTADGSMRPGFCGCEQLVLELVARRERPARRRDHAANAATHRARFVRCHHVVSSSMGLVLEIETEREVRRRGGRLELVLDFAAVSTP